MSVTGDLNRPPLEATPGNCALYQKAKKLQRNSATICLAYMSEASAMAISHPRWVFPHWTGSGRWAMGRHALHEHVVLAAMAPRAALIAGLLTSES